MRVQSSRGCPAGGQGLARTKWGSVLQSLWQKHEASQNIPTTRKHGHCIGWVQRTRKNSRNHIAASHSRQPLVKGERLVRYEVNAVMVSLGSDCADRFIVRCNDVVRRSLRLRNRRIAARNRRVRRWVWQSSCARVLPSPAVGSADGCLISWKPPWRIAGWVFW